jgi:hypothetical protein
LHARTADILQVSSPKTSSHIQFPSPSPEIEHVASTETETRLSNPEPDPPVEIAGKASVPTLTPVATLAPAAATLAPAAILAPAAATLEPMAATYAKQQKPEIGQTASTKTRPTDPEPNHVETAGRPSIVAPTLTTATHAEQQVPTDPLPAVTKPAMSATSALDLPVKPSSGSKTSPMSPPLFIFVRSSLTAFIGTFALPNGASRIRAERNGSSKRIGVRSLRENSR